jgi:hypothetical protein
MSEPRIPIGLDPNENFVSIEEAERGRPHYYRCPVCKCFLEARKGEVRIPHYAHYALSDSEDCPLRTEIGFNRWMETIRISPEEQDLRSHRLKLVLLKRGYSDDYELHCRLPTLSQDEFANNKEIEATLNTLQIHGESIDDDIPPSYFQPNEPEVLVRLYPDIKQYSITITSTVNISSIIGRWTGPGIRPNDIFVGNQDRAERTGSTANVREGDFIFIVCEPGSPRPDLDYQKHKLGPFDLIHFQLTNNNLDKVKWFLPNAKLDIKGFSIDLIVPYESNPQIVGPIYGKPDADAILAIIPPECIDPEFEVVTVPLIEKEAMIIKGTGPGIPRLLHLSFPKQGSQKLSIHWIHRHSFLQLHPVKEQREDPISHLAIVNSINKIGLIIDSIDIKSEYYPLDNPIINIPRNEIGVFLDIVKPLGPSNLSVRFKRNIGQDSPVVIEETTVGGTLSSIQSLLDNGLEWIVLDYGMLGTIKITFTKRPRLLDAITDLELESCIKRLKIDKNKKITPKMLRTIIEAEGYSGDEIPGGLKKRVRLIFSKMKKENGHD